MGGTDHRLRASWRTHSKQLEGGGKIMSTGWMHSHAAVTLLPLITHTLSLSLTQHLHRLTQHVRLSEQQQRQHQWMGTVCIRCRRQ